MADEPQEDQPDEDEQEQTLEPSSERDESDEEGGAKPPEGKDVAEEEEGAAEDAEETAIDEALEEEAEAAADEGEEEEAPPIVPRLPREPILSRLRPVGHAVRRWRGWTPTVLVLIFLLALFVRSYFYWQEARPDYLDIWLLSGNDPDYHKRAVDYLDRTHQWLAWDPLQNYPGGGPNPNPPAYETSVLLIGYLLTPFAPDSGTAVWWSMQFGGALWASLSIFPVYFVAREMFGRRAGMIAAFLLAVMAGNIERTPVGFSDHDGFLVFFLVCGFYFYIRAMEYTKNRTYVKSWRELDSVTSGSLAFLREHRIAVLYTLLASTMWGITALAWKGFPYIYAIVLVYYFIQVIAARWVRREDPFAIAMLTMISFTWIFLMTAPYYYFMHFMHWYEIYYLLWAAAAVITFFFVPTRNVPWILIVVVLAALGASIWFGLNAFAPEIANTVFSGAGYFSRSKLYNTIAEAQPPDVSRLLASYGYFTSLLAMGGVGVMAWRLPRQWSNHYLLMLVWAGTAVFMALSAVRFMYNATPVFAVLAGWIIWGIIDKTHFSVKTYRERWRKYKTWRKVRTIPVGHWAVAFFIAFAIVFPNVIQGLDAGIPFESKKEWDKNIYNSMPDLTTPSDLRILGWNPLNDTHVFRPDPKDFDPNGTGLWYLGAFGTSYMNDYWAVGMHWLSTQDRELTEEQRPGFISWWDYGHWAMHVGEHPTAADNFQNGFEFAGNFIGAQGEENASALILARFLETRRDDPGIVELGKQYLGEDGWALMLDYGAHPQNYVKQIQDNPAKYGRRDAQISDRNAFLILTDALIREEATADQQVWWIRDIKERTGLELRYFAVDVRMFPFSASNTGIFYAPIILADFDRNDFVEVRCTLDTGATIPCDQVTNFRTVTGTNIVYKDSFYNSMFVRAYLGYTANDMKSLGFNGFPGIQQSCTAQQNCLSGTPPMQGWNMSHWRLVQRSVYFNPNATDLANHSQDWRIITDEQANLYEGDTNVTVDRQFLGLGERTGTGVMFLKYYAGAFVNGTVRDEQGHPVAGARVTVYDDVKLSNPSWVGVPHGVAFTDENGSYRILAPFGKVTLVATTGGNPDPFQLREQIELGRVTVPVSDNQAMRIDEDLDGNGEADYNIHQDIATLPGVLEGRLFLDKDTNGFYATAADLALEGAQVRVHADATNATYTTVAGVDGSFALNGVAPGNYLVTASFEGHNWTVQPALRVPGNTTTRQDGALRGATVTGNVTGLTGAPVANSSVALVDLQTGEVQTNLTDGNGLFKFNPLYPGNYTLRSNESNATPYERAVTVGPGEVQAYNFSVIPTVPVRVEVFIDRDSSGALSPGEGAVNATVEVRSKEGDYFNLTRVGADGTLDTRYPAGNYTVRAQYIDPLEGTFAALVSFEATATSAVLGVKLAPAVHVNGTVFRDVNQDGVRDVDNTTVETPFASAELVLENAANGETTRVLARQDGEFDLLLPWGTYYARVIHSATGLTNAQVAFLTIVVDGSTTRIDVPLVNGTKLTGRVGYDADRSGLLVNTEQIEGANLTFQSGPYKVALDTTTQGDFSIWLLDGNWSVTARVPGYATNTTYAVVNASATAAVNSKDVFVEALPVTVRGRVGHDRNGDGVLSNDEGFDNVTVVFSAESAPAAWGYGANATVTTNATGDYTATLEVGRYAYNVSVDRGNGTLVHRYATWDPTANSAVLHTLFVPQADAYTVNESLREYSHFRGIVWYDENQDGIAQNLSVERPAGAILSLTSGDQPITVLSEGGGRFDRYIPSGIYTLDATYVAGGVTAKALRELNLTAPQNLGLLRLLPLQSVTVHAFDDKNGNGVDDDAADPILGLDVLFTNITSTPATIVGGNGALQLLAGRSYHYAVDDRRQEPYGPANQTVQLQIYYKAEGEFYFDPASPSLSVAVPRLLPVTGAFYWDRNGDGRYTPGEREEPLGASLEFRNASDVTQIRASQAIPPVGAYTVWVPRGNYTITVNHTGFDTTNSSWGVVVGDVPPPSGFHVDIILKAHDVALTGFTYLDINRNGELNRFEAGTPVTSLKLFNATNLSDVQTLAVDPAGQFNATLKPGTYHLYGVGTVNGTPVAGFARAELDPIGGFAWANISLRQAFTVSGTANFTNTTGEMQLVPAIDYTVTSSGVNFTVPQPAGAYNLTIPDGLFRVNATVSTIEFGAQMNYTANEFVTIDFENVTRDLNFTKVRRYTAAFDWTQPVNQSLAQGEAVNYTATIRNTGTENLTFDLTASGSSIPPGWTYQLEVTNVTLDIGGSQTFWILINTSNQTRAGSNTLQVRATPRNASGEGGVVDFTVTTRQDWGIDARPDVDSPSDQGASTTYFLAIENKGNGVDKLQVVIGGLPPGYSATPDQGAPGREMEVQPFTTARVVITLTRNASAPIAAPGSTFLVTVSSVSNVSFSDSAVFTIVYADLHVRSDENASRAAEPGKGSIVERGPLTTPGFELGTVAAALALLAVAARRLRGGRRP